MSDAVLTIEALTVGYDGAPVVRGLDLHVGAGEVVALLGANGAGKTTTLRAISGLLRPLSGRILFAGTDTAKIAPAALARRGVAHVPEGRGLFFGGASGGIGPAGLIGAALLRLFRPASLLRAPWRL